MYVYDGHCVIKTKEDSMRVHALCKGTKCNNRLKASYLAEKNAFTYFFPVNFFSFCINTLIDPYVTPSCVFVVKAFSLHLGQKQIHLI